MMFFHQQLLLQTHVRTDHSPPLERQTKKPNKSKKNENFFFDQTKAKNEKIFFFDHLKSSFDQKGYTDNAEIRHHTQTHLTGTPHTTNQLQKQAGTRIGSPKPHFPGD